MPFVSQNLLRMEEISATNAVTHIDNLMVHPRPKYWLRQTLSFKIKNSERARNRDLHRLLSLDSSETEFADSLNLEEEIVDKFSPEESASQKIEKQLTPEELQHLKRLTLDKASHLEVAEESGITVWSSQKRLERNRKKLRKIFPAR